MRDCFEIELAGGTTEPGARTDHDVVLRAQILSEYGADETWDEVVIRRVADPEPQPRDGSLVVTGWLMDRPEGPQPLAVEWDIVLVHLCEPPDPDHVETWLHHSRQITDGMPLAPVAWFELSDASAPWGEVHVTAIRDEQAVGDLIEHPLWAPSQPLLTKAVGRNHQLITRPLIDRMRGLGTGS